VSCYHRYVVTDDQPVTLTELERALRQVDPAFAIDGDTLRLGETKCGLIDVTYPGDPVCNGDLELLARLAEGKGNRDPILASLRGAECLVTVTPLCEDASVLQPLWDWLLANRAGILAFEGAYFRTRAGILNWF
jgi:hypothetical protein